MLRLFLEDILDEIRIATHDTSRGSSMHDEDPKEEDKTSEKEAKKAQDNDADDDGSLLGSCAHFLERLTKEELNNLSKLLKIKQYEEGDIVFKANDESSNNNLVMVLSGTLKCISNGSIIKDYEILYKDDSLENVFDEDIVAENYTITAEVTAVNIKSHFGSEI